MVGRADAVGRQVHHLRAAGIGDGAVGSRGQGGVLAPARHREVAQVQIEQLVGDGGDLAAGRFTPGLRQHLQRRAEGAEHAVLLEGVGQGLVGVLGAAEQERGGGERSGGDGGGHPGTSCRVRAPASPCGCSRTIRVGRSSVSGSTVTSGGRVCGSARRPCWRAWSCSSWSCSWSRRRMRRMAALASAPASSAPTPSSNLYGSRCHQRRSSAGRISNDVWSRTWPPVVANRRTLPPGMASVGTGSWAEMLPSEPTDRSGPKGAPPSSSRSGQAANFRSTVAVMRSLVPPGPLTGVTWRRWRRSPADGTHGVLVVGGPLPEGPPPEGPVVVEVPGLTVTVTVAIPQSAVSAAVMTLSHRLYWN